MNSEKIQHTDGESSPIPPKKPFSFTRLLLIAVVIAGMAGGYFFYTYRLYHQRTQQIDHAFEKTLAAMKQNLDRNESELIAIRDQQSEMAAALQKIQNTPPSPPAVSSPAPNPDISAAYDALSALDRQLDTLPAPQANTTSAPDTAEPETTGSWRDRLLHILRPIWHQLVTIRHTGENTAIMTPAMKELVLLRLHSGLDAAKWAVLLHDASVYKAALDNTRQTLGQYFAEDATKAVVERLDALVSAGIPRNTAVTPTVH